MKKTLAALIAVSALSTAAFAAGDDHGGNGKDRQTYISTSNTSALEVAPSIRKERVKEHYLNWNQLR